MRDVSSVARYIINAAIAWVMMARLLVVLLATPTASAIAPSFDTFLESSLGRWRGASYCWTPSETKDALPLSVAPGYITKPTPSSTEVVEVMRSCGGAVQGVEEKRDCQPMPGAVTLNRQVDGTTFFSFGSWAVAPTLLTEADESDLLASSKCFGISACIAHADRTRRMQLLAAPAHTAAIALSLSHTDSPSNHAALANICAGRFLLVVADGELACCDVAIEGHETDVGVPSVAEALLGGRLQCVVEANCWEGGASTVSLEGRPPTGSGWINQRTGWRQDEGELDGGAGLIPSQEDDVSLAYLPGGCWVRTKRTEATDGGDEAAQMVEVGRLTIDAPRPTSLSPFPLAALSPHTCICGRAFAGGQPGGRGGRGQEHHACLRARWEALQGSLLEGCRGRR